MEDITIEGLKNKTIELYTDTKTVKVKLSSLMQHYEIIYDASIDSREKVLRLVNHQIIGENKEIKYEFVDDELTKYILAYLEFDLKLKEYYDNTEVFENQFDRFIQSVTEYLDSIAQQIASSIQTVIKSMNKVITPMVDDLVKKLAKAIDAMLTSLRGTLSNLKIIGLTEEEKREWIDSCKSWGEYGWAVPLTTTIDVTRYKPIESKDAYLRMKKYCTPTEMHLLFDEMRTFHSIRQHDLEEAIYDYEKKKYKSCILILFSLLDSKLIRKQKKPEKGTRPSGSKAAENILEEKINQLKKYSPYSLFPYYNLLEAIKTYFEYGDDFKTQPKVANRNFIDHGMLHRDVRKKDCDQMFFIIYNYAWLIEEN